MRRLCLIAAFFCSYLVLAVPAQADFSEFEVQSANASLSSYQAGAHADLTTTFKLKSELSDGEVAQTKDVRVDLPPGLLGNPTALPQCTVLELSHESCPQESQVGVTEILVENNSSPILQPVYNMTSPGGGVVARLGFMAGFYPTTVNVRVRSDTDYGATATIEGAAALAGLREATTTIWGVPGSPIHDSQRITPSEGGLGKTPPGGGRSSTLPPAPFLSNPTRCGVPLQVSISADSYQLPQFVSTKVAFLGTIVGCEKLTFQPSFSATPTTHAAAAPSGLDVDLNIPQDETVNGRATAHLKDAKVTLPEGMTIAAGAAAGLEACSSDQAGYKTLGPASCPAASKLGTAEFDVPDLERPLQGAVYQRTPEPGHLFRVWIVADDLGVHVALPGEIELDEKTGRITTSFLDNPQVPLRQLRLHLFGGSRGPLMTPGRCGTYSTHWELTPWSSSTPASGDASMTIDEGCGTEGFAPELSAGSAAARAAAFSSFSVDLLAKSGEQNISKLAITLPPGLLAKLKGVPLCQGAEALTGSCPPGSRIGWAGVASGPGSAPLWIPQPGKEPTSIFLGGPYEGAPYSMIVRVPAQAGPFDLGTVVVRSAVRVNRETAQVTVESDPLPQILQGVPIAYRDIRAVIDRPNFTLNPTSCKKLATTSTLTSIVGAVAHPEDGFQVAGCKALGFRPKLKLRLKGGTKRRNYPALTATLTTRSGDANIGSVSVALPHSEFLAQEHIRTICTRVQFAADNCPAGSVYGQAKVWTPLLGKPLSGPVYLRSSNHPLPDLVVSLEGGIDIALAGRIDSVGGGIRTTFGSVPDAPVTKFVLKMKGGQKSLLVNSRDLCQGPQRAQVKMSGQNGKRLLLTPKLQARCGKR